MSGTIIAHVVLGDLGATQLQDHSDSRLGDRP